MERPTPWNSFTTKWKHVSPDFSAISSVWWCLPRWSNIVFQVCDLFCSNIAFQVCAFFHLSWQSGPVDPRYASQEGDIVVGMTTFNLDFSVFSVKITYHEVCFPNRCFWLVIAHYFFSSVQTCWIKIDCDGSQSRYKLTCGAGARDGSHRSENPHYVTLYFLENFLNENGGNFISFLEVSFPFLFYTTPRKETHLDLLF